MVLCPKARKSRSPPGIAAGERAGNPFASQRAGLRVGPFGVSGHVPVDAASPGSWPGGSDLQGKCLGQAIRSDATKRRILGSATQMLTRDGAVR